MAKTTIKPKKATTTQAVPSDLKNCVHPRENIYFGILLFFGVCIYFFVGRSLMHVFMPSPKRTQMLLLFGPKGYKLYSLVIKTLLFSYLITILLITLYVLLSFLGFLRGNAVKATEKQFPLVMKLLKQHTKKLGMHSVPTVYILHGHGFLQALALRIFARNYIVLFSDVLATATDKEGEEVVSFIIAHELGHIQRKHVYFLRNLFMAPAMFIPFLGKAYSRCREYTCDAFGHYLAPQGAERGIALLAAGRFLYKEVDLDDFMLHALAERGLATWVNEIGATHPHLAKRLLAIRQRKTW